MRVFLLVSSCLASISFWVGCDALTSPDRLSIYDSHDPLDHFIKNLETETLEVRRGSSISQPFFSVTGHLLYIENEQVQTYVYPTPSDAAREAASISGDGATIQNQTQAWMITWIAPPHFFRSDRLIVIYIGTDQVTLKTLNSILGSQFAGL